MTTAGTPQLSVLPSNHPPFCAEQILDTAITLTERRDVEQLVETLRAFLKGLFPTGHVAFYQFSHWTMTPLNGSGCHGNEVRDTFESNAPWITVDAIRGIPQAIAERRTVQTTLDGGIHRIVIPVENAGISSGYLVLDDTPLQPGMLPALERLCRLIANHIKLLTHSQTDPLTGLFNRQMLEFVLTRRLAGAKPAEQRRREGTHPHFLALIDIDHFKRINDSFGHLFGDEVLLLFSRLMLSSFRHQDGLFRYGGEEFAILFQSANPEAARRVLNRFRKRVERYPFPQVDGITISIGFVLLRESAPAGVWVEKADRALYFAKNDGRNRVHSFDALLAGGKLQEVEAREGQIELF